MIIDPTTERSLEVPPRSVPTKTDWIYRPESIGLNTRRWWRFRRWRGKESRKKRTYCMYVLYHIGTQRSLQTTWYWRNLYSMIGSVYDSRASAVNTYLPTRQLWSENIISKVDPYLGNPDRIYHTENVGRGPGRAQYTVPTNNKSIKIANLADSIQPDQTPMNRQELRRYSGRASYSEINRCRRKIGSLMYAAVTPYRYTWRSMDLCLGLQLQLGGVSVVFLPVSKYVTRLLL